MATRTSAGSGLASATGTWVGGVVPVEGDKVIIAAGHVVTVNGTFTWGDDTVTQTINNGAVNVSGTLKASRSVSSSLTVKGAIIMNQGTHGIDYGTDADPIPDGVIAELVLNKATTPAYRVGMHQVYTSPAVGGYFKNTFVGYNGRLRGVPLATDAAINAGVIALSRSDHGWKVGDEIMLFTANQTAGNTNQCEFRQVLAVSGASVTLNSPLSYLHLAGSPVANLTCNVIIRPFNTATNQNTTLNFGVPNNSSATLGYTLHMKNIRMLNVGNAATNQGMLFCGGNSPQGLTPLEYTFYRSVFTTFNSGGVFIFNPAPRMQTMTECVVYGPSMTLFYQGHAMLMTNCWFGLASLGSLSGTGQQFIDCWVTGVSASLTLGVQSGATLTRVTLSGCGNSALEAAAVGVTLNDCDIGYTYGYNRYYGGTGVTFINAGGYTVSQYTLNNCLLHSNLQTPGSSSAMETMNEQFNWVFVDKNQDVTQQDVYTRRGTALRDNATKFRSASSISMQPRVVGLPFVREIPIFCGAGKTIRVVGYVRVDAAFYNAGDYTAPVVSLSGLGATAATFSASGSAGTWQKFDFTLTNLTANDGSFKLACTTVAKTVNTGVVHLDGVPYPPFVTQARHYGFLFNEGLPTRTVNPVNQADEATAYAYTGVAIDAATPRLTISAGTANTWLKVYDHYQAWACQNLAQSVLLVSADGVNFNVPADMRVLLSAVPTGGTLGGGIVEIPSPGAYAYNLSSSTLEFATAGTYSLSASKLSGVVKLTNVSGGAVTVSLPAGTEYDNLGPSITVVAAQTSLTLTEMPTGSDVVVLTAGTSTILEQADSISGTQYVFQYTGTPLVDIGVIKPGYKPKYLRNLQLGTTDTAIPVSLDVDRSYLP